MGALEGSLRRDSLLILMAVVCISVLAGYACGTGSVDLLVGLSGVTFFALLVWDLRIIVPVIALVGPFGPKFAMSFGNLYLTTVIVILGFVAWIWRNPLQARPFTIRRNRITDSIFIFLAIMFVSSLQNLDYLFSNTLHLLRFVQFFLYTSFFVVILSLPFSKQQIKAILILVLAVGVAQGILGVWQWLTSPGVFVSGTFDYRHSNYAVYVVFIALLLLGVTLESRSHLKDLPWVSGLGALLAAVVFSLSRGGYVSLAAGVAVAFFMPHRRSRKVLLLVAIGICAAIALSIVPSGIFQRTRTIALSITGRDVAVSFSQRLGMWGRALADFARNPILGKGTWSYSLRDNFYVKVLGETGILGICAFLWLLWTILRTEWHAVKERIDDDFVRGLTFGLLPATVASVAVFNLSADLFVLHRFMGTFWMVLALVLQYVGAQGGRGYVQGR